MSAGEVGDVNAAAEGYSIGCTDAEPSRENENQPEIDGIGMLERRSTLTCTGIVEEEKEFHGGKADLEPSYYARERIIFHLGRLLKDFPFFSELELELQLQLPEIVYYVFHPAESLFFQQGDAGDQCYILLTGVVDVWKSNSDYNMGAASPSGESHKRSKEESPKVAEEKNEKPWKIEAEKTLPVSGGTPALQRKCAAIAHMLSHSGTHTRAEPETPGTPGSATLFTGGRRSLKPHGNSAAGPTLKPPNTQGVQAVAVESKSAASSSTPAPAAATTSKSAASSSTPAPAAATNAGTEAAKGNTEVSFERESRLDSRESRLESKGSRSSQAELQAEKRRMSATESSSLAARKGQSDLRIQVPGGDRPGTSGTDRPGTSGTSGTDRPQSRDRPRSRGSCSVATDDSFGDVPPWKRGAKIASLGHGALFGEQALLEDLPRNATIVCQGNCEVLAITKEAFDVILKKRMRDQKHQKLAFIRRHVPGMVDLADNKLADYAYLFKPLKFPKGHYFAKQGGSTECVLWFLFKGSVEFRMESLKNVPVFCGLPEVGNRRLGSLVPGGMFGSLYPHRYEPFSIVATTSPCDVYRLSREDMRRLPEAILRSLRDSIDSLNQWRVGRCDSPAGTIVGTVPRTLPNLRPGRKCRPRKVLPFDLQEEKIQEDATMFDMAPGEILALKGKPPRASPQYHAKSMPNLHGAGSRPTSVNSSIMSGGSRVSSRPQSSLFGSRPMSTPMSSIMEPL
jgi:CRP-like cAMP-binding protein